LGRCYSLNKEYLQSIDELNNSIKLGLKSPRVYINLAIGFYHLDLYESAMLNAIKAKNLDSTQKQLKENEKEYLDWLLNELQQKMNQR
jgi:hypothetical protein